MKRQTESAASICWRIEQHFETERLRIEKQIKNYPRPIAVCDVQFNYLLEERARIARELHRLRVLSHKYATKADPVEFLDEYTTSANNVTMEAA